MTKDKELLVYFSVLGLLSGMILYFVTANPGWIGVGGGVGLSSGAGLMIRRHKT